MPAKPRPRAMLLPALQEDRVCKGAVSPSEDELSEDELRVVSEGGARLCSSHHRPAPSALSSATSSAASVATSGGSTAALVRAKSKRPLIRRAEPAPVSQRERNILLANPRLPQIAPTQKDKLEGKDREMKSLVECEAKSDDVVVDVDDSRPSKFHVYLPQVLAAISVSLGNMLVGFVSGYTAPALVSMQEDTSGRLGRITNHEESLTASLLPLFAIFGGMCGGVLIDRLGRHRTTLFMGPPFLISFLSIAFAQSIWYVYIGRCIAGLCTGIISLAVPVYLGEALQSEVRGVLGLLPTTIGNLGFLVCFCTGRYLDWSQLALFGAIIPIPFMICMFLIPETPRWYISKDKKKRARKALQWLRGRDTDVSQEFDENERCHQESLMKRESSGCLDLLSARYRRPVLVALGLMLFQQMSGINAVMFFNTDIFKAAKSSLDPKVCTIIIGVINLITVFVGSALIDRLGRKILLYASGCIMSVTITTLGAYFWCYENDETSVAGLGWIPMTSFGIYIVGFSIGFGPVPWLMMGEILPAKVRGSGASVTTTLNWFTTFMITFTFKHFGAEMGYSKPFLAYGLCCFISLFFIFFFVPETQGRSLEEIERIMVGDEPVKKVAPTPSRIYLGSPDFKQKPIMV